MYVLSYTVLTAFFFPFNYICLSARLFESSLNAITLTECKTLFLCVHLYGNFPFASLFLILLLDNIIFIILPSYIICYLICWLQSRAFCEIIWSILLRYYGAPTWTRRIGTNLRKLFVSLPNDKRMLLHQGLASHEIINKHMLRTVWLTIRAFGASLKWDR